MKANLKIAAGVSAALLLAGNASAAVLTAPVLNYSKEGLQTTGTVTLGPITAVLAADYSLEDRISVTIGGGAAVVAATDLTADMTCTNGITVGFLNRSGNTVNFRVTQVTSVNNLGATCTIAGIQVSKASLATATKVTGTYAASTRDGDVIDTGCANPAVAPAGVPRACTKDETPNLVTLANVRSQFTAEADEDGFPFNGVINVEKNRELFVDGVTDTLDIFVRNEGDLEDAVPGVNGSLVLKGDFSWAAGKDGKCGTADDVGAIDTDLLVAADITAAADCKSVEFDYGLLPDGEDAEVMDTITLTVPGEDSGVKLSPQSFAAEYSFVCSEGCLEKTIAFDAGRWTINGALVFVPYMPYGDNISQIIYVANRGGQTGEITIDAFDEQGATYSFSGGTVANGTVKMLSGIIRDGLVTAGFKAPGKVAFEITVNAPDKDIDVYSAYNVGGSDRGTVVNSQNGKALK